MGHRPCMIHCPGDDGGLLGAVAGMVLAAAGGVLVWQAVAAAVAVLLLPLAAAAVVLAAVSVPVTRRLAARVCVPRWSAAYTPAARPSRVGMLAAAFWRWALTGAGTAATQTALPAGTSLMLEQAQPKVYVITDVKERTGHGR